MQDNVVKEEEIIELSALIASSKRIAITCHMSPDGDALGSSLGLMHLLRDMGKIANVITPDIPPATLAMFPGIGEVVAYSRFADRGHVLLHSADLILCVDFNMPMRVDKLAPALLSAKGKKVMIDHHEGPDAFCDLTISYPKMSSACELVYRLLTRITPKPTLSRTVATCLYIGMHTDTGGFSYNANDPDIYLIIADLLKLGVDKNKINIILSQQSERSLRINGFAISEKMQIFPESKASLISLSQEELVKFGYSKGDSEGLVNMPLRIPEVIWSTYLREDKEFVKVSMRSQGDFAVNALCERYFGGGGHINAAGGEFHGTLKEAEEIMLQLINEYKNL